MHRARASCKPIISSLLVPSATALLSNAVRAAIPVIQEDFQDDIAGSWQAYGGAPPSNVGRPGQWLNSGHVPNMPIFYNSPDLDWRPQVQNNAAVLPTLPTGSYMATFNRRPSPSQPFGVFNMDGIIKFTLADGTPRPAVTGEKIVGSFSYIQQDGNFGFGFTDNIPALQSYQASLPLWKGATSSPVMMPTGFTDIEPDEDGSPRRVPFSSDVTGHIEMTGGYNNLYTHAAVDIAENGGAGDGFVDQGGDCPKTDPNSTAHRPLGAVSAKQMIRFEYTVGNPTYDVLQVEQNISDGLNNWVDITQGPDSTGPNRTPNPNGPMPVGKVMPSIEGMFITGANGRLTEVWYDDINVSIVIPAVGWIGNSGNWETGSNWHDGVVPNAVDAVALFAQEGINTQAITLSSPITVGTLRFNSTNNYTLTGTGSLTIQSAGVGTVEALQGTQEIGVPLNFASDAKFTVSGGNLTVSGPTTITSGKSVTKNGNVTLSGGLALQSGASLVAETGTMTINGAPSLASGAKIDLKSTSMTVDYSGQANPSGTILGALATGYAGGAWTGNGIDTSSSIAGRTGVGWKDNTALEKVQIRYTYYGDADLDGSVSTADFTTLAQNFNKLGVWATGDFNYDGVVNALDFNAVATNFGSAPLPAPGLGSLVPEPANLLALGALGLLRRRSRSLR